MSRNRWIASIIAAILTSGALVALGAASSAGELTPVSPNASAESRTLLNWLAHLPNRVPIHGKVASGLFGGYGDQYSTAQADELGSATTQLPTIHGCDYAMKGGVVSLPQQLPNLINLNCNGAGLSAWQSAGGVITVSVEMSNPVFVRDVAGQRYAPQVSMNGGGVKPRDNQDQSRLDFQLLLNPFSSNGMIWRAQLAKIAQGLHQLGNAPVLFRPFPRMNGTEFWWSDQVPVDFIDVWREMFTYLTIDEGLSNLLWVYAPADGPGIQNYYPDGMVDIVALDVGATNPAAIGGYGDLLTLNKPIAMTGIRSPAPGSFDYTSWVDAIRTRFPQTSYFVIGNNGDAPQSNANARAFMNHPWLINRAETNGLKRTEPGTNGFSTQNNVTGTSAQRSDLAVTSWGPERMDVFLIRHANGVRDVVEHRTYLSGVLQTTVDYAMDGTFFSINWITAVSWGFGRIDLVVNAAQSSTGPQTMFHARFTPGWDGEWEVIGGFGTSSGELLFPTITSWGPERLDVFADCGSAVCHRSSDGMTWAAGWENLGFLPGLFVNRSPVAVSPSKGRTYLLALNDNRRLNYRPYGAGGFEGPWQTVANPAGLTLMSLPAATSWAENRMDVFATGNNGGLWHLLFDNNVPGTWEQVGANNPKVIGNVIGATARALRKLDLFYLDTANPPQLFRLSNGCGANLCDGGLQ
ncbi:MAG TPA: glycosyl hydrolase, partial [Candidatus Limnocylindrales bacterium]|nr:glycosyl hydrolase [Candidatus Limnocylindrales bacterium]